MLWKFRVSEVIYLVLSAVYILGQGFLLYQVLLPENISLVQGWLRGLLVIAPLFIFIAIHIFFGIMELVLYFYYKDKNKVEANFAINNVFFYLVSLAILSLAPSILHLISEAILFYSSIFILQITAILILISVFFRQQKEV